MSHANHLSDFESDILSKVSVFSGKGGGQTKLAGELHLEPHVPPSSIPVKMEPTKRIIHALKTRANFSIRRANNEVAQKIDTKDGGTAPVAVERSRDIESGLGKVSHRQRLNDDGLM